MTNPRLSLTMSTPNFDRRAEDGEAPSDRAGRLALWIVLALGLLLMLASTGKAEQGEARRTDRVNGTLAAGQSLQVENVSGDIVASPGKEFSAVVSITVSAPTQKQAEELLQNTRILQSHDDDGWSLETSWPGMHGRSDRGRGACPRCRVVANYELTVPPGVEAELQTVNGGVRVRDLDGELRLESVNGEIEARGLRKSFEAQTVNGEIHAQMLSLGAEDRVELQSVNGSATLTLPKDAKFTLSAETMNGTIASTFPFATPAPRASEKSKSPKGATPPPSKSKTGKPRQIVITDDQGDTTTVNLDDIDAEFAESMHEYEWEMREAEKEVREAEREMRQIRVMDPRREFSGSIGGGGATVRVETLNGTVTVLASGTAEADAKPLVSERRSFVVTVPPVHVRIPPVPPVPPVAPIPPVPPQDDYGDGPGVVRGNISGDFLSTSNGNYRIGDVTGRVKILTHSGEIRVGSIGAGADVKTFGGDIILGPVTGDLKASTMAGDIRSSGVTGSAVADTAGGDIRIERVGSSLDAKTAGGDIVVGRVVGSVRAMTAGGDIRIAVASSALPGGIVIQNMGGDVSLSLPSDCKADVELVVEGPEEDDLAIRSEFPDLTISRRPGSQRATAKLNGGGERVVVKTSSGMIRLKKAANP